MDTIGKRIAKNRKALGWTQDQLADKIGITAQAVSKWENDLSCPDITILPKLADIFDTTTDALLGRDHTETTGSVANPVKQDKRENGFTYDSDSGEMDFHWDGARLGGICLACWVILTGSLYLLTRLLSIDISFWNVLWPTFLLAFGLFGLYPKFSVFRLGCALAGTYFLLEKTDILPLKLNGGILIAVLVVLFGVALLADTLKKGKKATKRYHPNNHRREFYNDYSTDGNTFSYDASFGNSEQTVKIESLKSGTISVNFGEYTVDLTNVASVENNCRLSANCSFGQLHIRIPRCFQIVSASSTSFAGFEIEGVPDTHTKGTIQLDADVSFGAITICYI